MCPPLPPAWSTRAGWEFGSDGSYVAEAGQGNIEPHHCPGDMHSPLMPYQIGMTGQVSKISPTDERTMVLKAPSRP